LAQYYYTVSALPHLFFDGEVPISSERFLGLCEDTLEKRDGAILKKTRLHGTAEHSGNATLASWSEWEMSLRGELAKLRAGKKGLETEKYAAVGLQSGTAMDTARNAFGETSPASAENMLLHASWMQLDELEVGHFFDIDKLIIYYLRLQILELKKSRNRADGEKNFSDLYESVLQKNPD